jgi:pteridine reductase
MDASNSPRTALITGAAKRVGRAVALRMADAGFDIAFTYLTSGADAQSLITQVQSKGRRCLGIAVDLFNPQPAAQAIGDKLRTFSNRLDLLMNNASIYEPSGLDQTDAEQIRRLFAIHFESPLMLCQTFAPMLRASGGRVVNMVDDLVERPLPKFMAYCASKSALWNLTLSVARELAPQVTVNGIAPGVAQWAEGTSEQEKQEYLKRVPLGRAGTPQDIAEMVRYLCFEGSYITGQILHVDGGRSIT